MKISFCSDSYQALNGTQHHGCQRKSEVKDPRKMKPQCSQTSAGRGGELSSFHQSRVSDLLAQADPGVRQQRQAALQQQGPVRLPGRGLHGLLLPLPRLRIAQVRRGVPLRQEVALRAGGGGGWRDHKEQVCVMNEHFWDKFMMSVLRFPQRTTLILSS